MEKLLKSQHSKVSKVVARRPGAPHNCARAARRGAGPGRAPRGRARSAVAVRAGGHPRRAGLPRAAGRAALPEPPAPRSGTGPPSTRGR